MYSIYPILPREEICVNARSACVDKSAALRRIAVARIYWEEKAS